MNKSKLSRFIRRQLYCRRGIHCDMEYFEPIAMICGKRKCKDCGEISPAIKWPMPPCKPPKTNFRVSCEVKKPIRNQQPLCLESLIDFADASKPVVWIEVTRETLRRLRALKDDNERYLVKVNHVLPEINTLLGYNISINDKADGVEMHIQTSAHDVPCIKRLLI